MFGTQDLRGPYIRWQKKATPKITRIKAASITIENQVLTKNLEIENIIGNYQKFLNSGMLGVDVWLSI